MENPTILELRGNGALVRVCSLPNSDLEFLHEAARKYGEELCTAWFDPAFRWKKEVRDTLDNVQVLSEHRGLLMDGRSFLEVRRSGKRRRKFLIEELLNTDLLFPLVASGHFEFPMTQIIIEITYGTGCMAQFEMEKFSLSELELGLFSLPSIREKLALFTKYQNKEVMVKTDDFVVRGMDLQIVSAQIP